MLYIYIYIYILRRLWRLHWPSPPPALHGYSANSNNSYSVNSDNSYSIDSNNSYSINSNNSDSINSNNGSQARAEALESCSRECTHSPAQRIIE